MARAHVRHHKLDHFEQRKEIQFHQAARLFDGHVPGGQVGAHPGIVNEDIDGAEPFQVRATTRRRVSSLVRSPGVMSAAGPARLRPSSERAVSDSFAPTRANSAAQAAPMPSDAPVMRTTLPSIRIETT